MKFVCDGMILSDAALVVSKACAAKTITPVLECIKLQAKNDGLTLKAYDGEISIEKKIKAEILEEGELCVNGKTFADFVGKIAAFEVVIASDEKGISIKYADSESYMQALSATDFPVFGDNTQDVGEYFEIKEADLKTLISKVVFCCATDESRPILKGCLMETKDNQLTATALDGFRMACSYCDVLDGSGEMKIVCPARTLTEISRMLGNENTLKIYASKNLLSVAVEDTVINSRLYSGEFVRKENIYPVDFTTKVQVKRSELIDSVERASVLIRGDKNNLILLDVKHDKIIINANSDMGKVEETVSATDMEGKELKIAMNGKYLLDALKALEEEIVVLSFNTSVSPFTIENVEDKSCQYLVLPVRTSQQA
ncbi:MAG: DNA polymerase III subunit beta [Clostridiales bacterium]|nr:DNA polymerase III subunit beta [Clostridiales bacterium]